MTIAQTTLWVYIGLLLVGGLIGFLKAGSKVSLIMAAIFAVLLTLCALQVLPIAHLAEVLMGALVVVFAIRLKKTKKFIPSGLMLAVTLIGLVVRWVA